MSSTPPSGSGPAEPSGAAPAGPGAISPAARWRGWPEVRADLRSSLQLALALAVAGLPAGVLWWALAPRADFRVTEDGPALLGDPPVELSVAGDSVLVLVLAALGLVAGAAAWAFLPRRRGVATVLALAGGGALGSLGAWQVGELLGRGPTEAELADIGAIVTTPLTLAALPALAVAPFTAVLVYLAATLAARSDDLGRTPAHRSPPAPAPEGTLDDELPADALR